MKCRNGGGEAPCLDDLCYSGNETLCGIPQEWIDDEAEARDQPEPFGERGVSE